MVNDIHIWRAARLLINRHGETADIAAAQRIGDLAEQGDLDGAAAWHRIQRAAQA